MAPIAVAPIAVSATGGLTLLIAASFFFYKKPEMLCYICVKIYSSWKPARKPKEENQRGSGASENLGSSVSLEEPPVAEYEAEVKIGRDIRLNSSTTLTFHA